MFKPSVFAAVLTLAAAGSNATPTPEELLNHASIAYAGADLEGRKDAPQSADRTAPDAPDAPAGTVETAFVCDWTTHHDRWGNWSSTWQCH